MTHRSRAVPRAAVAIMIAATLLGAIPGVTAAADPVSLQARTLMGGRFEAGGWAAVAVSLANDGEPVNGYLVAEGEDGTVRRAVELPAGSRKQVTIYVRPPAFGRTVTVRFTNEDGKQLATADGDVRVLERTTGHVAVVGDGGGNLRPQLIARGSGLPEPIGMTAADLPERPEPMRGIETIVWAADSGGLTEAQRRSLERWVAAGGQLVVLGGPDWQGRAAAFADLLPVGEVSAVDDASLAGLGAWIGAPAPTETPAATVSVGQLRDGAVRLVGPANGALFATVMRGAGRVTWLGLDLATEPFRAWAGAPLLWSRLIPDSRILERFGLTGPLEEEVGNTVLQALSNLPALEVPPAELLLAVLIGYILLIGPASYFVLQRLDRRELAWVTAPVLVVVFSACSYGIGTSMKGSDIILNELTVIRSTTGGAAASVTSYAGLFSPGRSTYDLTIRGDALFSTLALPFDGRAPVALATEQGDPSRLRGLAVNLFTLEGVRADTVVPYTPSLRVSWTSTRDGIQGTVANDGELAMEDVAIVTQSGGQMIGTLVPGETRPFTLAPATLAGSSASQQVYGLGGEDASPAGQRQVAVRRQMIDALVGYGGGRPGLGVAPGIDRGPYVIGWQSGASPVPIEVDGHEVQHFVQAVEVLAGQPRLGPGPVVVQPSQMITRLVATSGDAFEPDPGYVTMSNGEAVFQLTLPLEAAGLVPSSLSLLAGTDEGMIVWDQPNLRSVLPDGFRLGAYDLVAEEWIDIGDLSQDSRFEVAEPSRLLDAAGRILVRITASDLADEGQWAVVAGATVGGVI
ncbi:MAG: hypothetical protein ACRDHD_00470 [Candidatus Limnocylindria bacterium]